MGMRRLILLFILSLLLAYTGFQVSLAVPARPAAWGLIMAFFVLALSWPFIYHIRGRRSQPRWLLALAWLGSFGLGLWATFILLSLPLDIGSFFAFPPPQRAVLALLGGSGVIAGLGLRQALAGPQVKRVSVDIPSLPQALQGLRIAQLSDLHVGPTIRRAYVEEVVRTALALNPDLIAVTGDMGDGTVATLAEQLEPLSKLKARLGTYFVTGNHEYYWGPEQWLQKVAELGMIPLINENRVVGEIGAKILVAGVTDRSSHHFIAAHRSDPRQAAATTETCALKILLAHRPDSCLEAEPAGFDLQLSGHTHAGQFFPFSLLIPLVHRYFKGLYRHGRMWLYVNSGTGYWGPPHRFNIPAEITLLTLEAKP